MVVQASPSSILANKPEGGQKTRRPGHLEARLKRLRGPIGEPCSRTKSTAIPFMQQRNTERKRAVDRGRTARARLDNNLCDIAVAARRRRGAQGASRRAIRSSCSTIAFQYSGIGQIQRRDGFYAGSREVRAEERRESVHCDSCLRLFLCGLPTNPACVSVCVRLCVCFNCMCVLKSYYDTREWVYCFSFIISHTTTTVLTLTQKLAKENPSLLSSHQILSPFVSQKIPPPLLHRTFFTLFYLTILFHHKSLDETIFVKKCSS